METKAGGISKETMVLQRSFPLTPNTPQEAPRTHTQTSSAKFFHPVLFPPPPRRRFCGVIPRQLTAEGSPRVGTPGWHPRYSTPLPSLGGSAPRGVRPGRFGKARAMILCYS